VIPSGNPSQLQAKLRLYVAPLSSVDSSDDIRAISVFGLILLINHGCVVVLGKGGSSAERLDVAETTNNHNPTLDA
jgi:hypothetical protein